MSLSASGVRIQGDDYQHLLSWHCALGMLRQDGPTRIEVEAKNAGSVDDIVVHWPDHREYIQVKFATDGRKRNNSGWWLERFGTRRSLLQKFWSSWKELRDDNGLPRMTLVTNRPRDPNDPVMQCISGRDGKLMPRLASRARRERAKWAEHLGVDEPDMLEMLELLSIRDGQERSRLSPRG